MEEPEEQQLSLKEYLRMIIRGKWIILICFLTVFTGTVYYTYTAHPVYEASAMVMIKDDAGIRRQLFQVTNIMQQESRINNQVEILKSLSLAESVIQSLQQSPVADSLYVLGKRKLEAKFTLDRILPGALKALFEKMRSFGPDSAASDSVSTTDLAEDFRKGMISVVPKRNTDMIELKVQAATPDEAAFIANTWMKVYQKRDLEESQGEATKVREFLETKVKDVQDTLANAEDALKNYKEVNKVAELPAETEQMIKQVAEFEAQYMAAKTDYEANEKRLNYLESQLDENQKAIVDEAASTSSSVIAALEAEMARLITEKSAYEQQLRSRGYSVTDDVKMNNMDQRIQGLQESITAEKRKMVASGTATFNTLNLSETLFNNILQIRTENKSLRARIDELSKIVDRYNRDLSNLPDKSLKLARLTREAEVNSKIFIMLREKYEENRIAEASQIGSVRIVDQARPPKHPIKPKKRTNLVLGFLMGLGLGVGVTLLKEYLDNSLKSSEEVERLGLPVLGSIPFISTQKIGRRRDGNGEIMRIESRLITHFAPKSPISEAYRTIRTNIQYSRADKTLKTAMVTSSGMGEGKSTSVANLAITFAQMGSKTLLVDTDLRRPVLHGIFEQSRNEGLTNVLVGRLSMEEAVKPTKIDHLSLVTSGTLPPNPSELLASKMMHQFIQRATSQYDIVLFDTPPIIAVTDAAVLASQLDGAILVIRSGVTNRDALLHSKALLDNVKANMLGILINGMNLDRMMGSYYYYYYSSDGKQKKH
ncbi:MAG: polysaccharide biosynthesis tyrosine autokinase [bacterium]|nr:polysaccharide biosynthesis tyrosine autokinase [bacterium]